MNLDELRKLSPEQAMQAAATDLSLPPDFFDRMWAQESGRGRNKLSKAGARGDFQIMPKTQAAWEQRNGRAFDADNFHDSLFMAQETMRENLKRFKDPVDATRAYNGGWNPKKWGNAETTGYVQALWGNRAPSKPGAPPVDVSPEEWPRVGVLPKGKQAPDSSDETAAAINIGTSAQRLAADASGVDAARAAGVAGEAAAAKVQAHKDATGVTAVGHDALRDPRVMPTWAVMSRLNSEAADPSFDYMARRDELEAGMNDDEREYMRENVTSEGAALRARAEVEYRRGVDQTYADAGALTAFAGQMAAGMADPASLVLGLGTVKAFQMARIGSGALAASGRGGAAALSMMGENAAANLVIEGVADAVGEVKTSADYAMAAGAGAILVAPFTRGVMRSANETSIANHARSLQERGVDEQSAAVTRVMQDEPALTPQQAARRVEEQEADTISRAVSEAVGPTKQDAVIPDDVRRSMEDEFQGAPSEELPVVAQATEPAATPVLPKEVESSFVEQLRKGNVTRNIDDGESVVTLDFALTGPKRAGHGTVNEALGAVANHTLATPVEKRLAQYLSRILNEDALGVGIRFSRSKGSSSFDPNTQQVEIRDPATGADGTVPTIGAKVQGLTKYGVETLLHEVFHVATVHRIVAWEQGREKLRPAQRKVLDQFDNLFQRFQAEVFENIPEPTANYGPHYSAKNLHEFAAQFFTDTETRHVLAQMPGKPVAGKVTTALREFMSIIRRVMGVNGKSALEEGAKLIDQMIAMPLGNVQFHNGKPALFGPEQGKGFNPLAARRSRDKWAEKITDHARTYMAQHPIDLKRLNVITDKIGGVSDGLKLAMSQNPIMQLVASLVTETTTGAAGRKSNVAIRSHMLHKKFIGNTMLEYVNSYNVYRTRNGGGILEDAFTGDVRRKFDQKVTEEVLARRRADHTPTTDQSVVEAADALERLFDRSRLGQVDAGVLGFGNLPETSRGYMPQALDGAKLQAASVQDLNLLHKALSEQFQARLGWDKKWADDFAPFYTERVRKRSQGSKNIDALGAGGEGLQGVRDALDELAASGGSAELVDRMRAALSKQGQGHTKKRLDLDLLAELRPGLRALDFYVTNPLVLARSYAKRTAGTAALTEAGIHGIRGIRELREASLLKQDGTQPTEAELAAFDRVVSEILGTPVAGEVVSAAASNLQLLVTLQRLGGLVFTQTAETFNMIHHLGLRSVLSGVPDLPRMMGEVGRLKRGEASGNHILTSLETYGGEIGMEGYKMVAPLDAPDAALSAYMNQPGLLSRLMRAGGHLQSKISGFRGVMAAQHRMVAEQIVMKAARYIRDGKSDVALTDMGFSPEVAASLRDDLKHIAKWDSSDRLVEFDLTRVSDARTAEAFVQAVHRGTSQIIQGTFIGERNAWFHNDYMRLLLQLRTFGLTATEKQWGRTRMNHGYTYAAGMLLGQMALSLPIHAARVQLMSMGREDREKYIKDNMHPAALIRATMNYSSLAGMTGDVLEVLSGVAGGWGDQRTKEILGARQQATSIGRIVPIAGSVDTAFRVASGKTDLHTGLKQLPFSNLWYLVPAINLTKDD